jgi:hypothetical protein
VDSSRNQNPFQVTSARRSGNEFASG